MTEEAMPERAWMPRFLASLRQTRHVKRSAGAVGVATGTIYYHRRRNGQFAKAWLAAIAPTPVVAGEEGGAIEGIRGWRIRFLETLAETSNVTTSALRANVPVQMVYKLRRRDPEFAAKWRAALAEGYDHLEMELLGHLRDPNPQRKMDVGAAIRLLAAHRQTVERARALIEEEDERALLDSIDRFIDGMRVRRAANTAILIEAERNDGPE